VVEKIDGDIAENGVGVVAGNVSETAAGEAHLAIGELNVVFGLADDGAGDVGRADGDEEVVFVVLVEERGVAGGNFNVIDVGEIVVEHEMVMGLLAERNGLGFLGGDGERENKKGRESK
jgi:hypothetical protein